LLRFFERFLRIDLPFFEDERASNRRLGQVAEAVDRHEPEDARHLRFHGERDDRFVTHDVDLRVALHLGVRVPAIGERAPHLLFDLRVASSVNGAPMGIAFAAARGMRGARSFGRLSRPSIT